MTKPVARFRLLTNKTHRKCVGFSLMFRFFDISIFEFFKLERSKEEVKLMKGRKSQVN
jgi:hypothetical protein